MLPSPGFSRSLVSSPWRHASAPGPCTRKTAGVVATMVAPCRTRSRRPRSRWRSSSGMSPGQLARLVAAEVAPDDVGGATGALVVRGREHRAAESGGARGGQSRQRILDHHAAVGCEGERGPRAVVALWVRLAGGHVLGGHDLAEVRPQAGQLEHELDLPAQGTAHDGELKAVERRVLDERLDTRHQPHRAADRPLVVGVLPLDRLEQRGLIGGAAHALEREAEALAVVEAEVIAVVGVAVERVALLAERGDEGVAMLRLVIDDDTVEVEQNGRGHVEGITGERVEGKMALRLDCIG